MATFVVKNIIKITSLVDFDASFKPYRQNFIYVLKGKDVLELRTNEPEKSLYYYKAVLPYAEVEMIDEFDYPTNAITYTITNGHKAGADVDELRDGEIATIHIVANEGYGYPLSIDDITVTNATKENYVAQNGGCAIDITSTGGDIEVSCSCFDPNIQITFPIGVIELGTKMAQDLQVGLTESDGVLTMGELFYVSDYSNFTTNTSGNYLPVTPSATTFDGFTNTYSVEARNEPSWETQEFNGNFVQWVDRSASGHPAGEGILLVTATIGTQEFTKEYDISAITLDEAQPQPTGLTPFYDGTDGEHTQTIVNVGDYLAFDTTFDMDTYLASIVPNANDTVTLCSAEQYPLPEGGEGGPFLMAMNYGGIYMLMANGLPDMVGYSSEAISEQSIPQGWFGLTNGKYEMSNKGIKITEINTTVTGWNGVFAGWEQAE